MLFSKVGLDELMVVFVCSLIMLFLTVVEIALSSWLWVAIFVDLNIE